MVRIRHILRIHLFVTKTTLEHFTYISILSYYFVTLSIKVYVRNTLKLVQYFVDLFLFAPF